MSAVRATRADVRTPPHQDHRTDRGAELTAVGRATRINTPAHRHVGREDRS
jgi:hypothetical protein